jgi:hypothetical protein
VQIDEHKCVAIIGVSRPIWLLRGLLGLQWSLLLLLLLLLLLRLFLETDRESRDWVLNLDRKLGLARNWLGRDVLLLSRGLLCLLGRLRLVVVDRMDILLEWLVKSKVPKTEMLETHANGIQFQRIFAPDVIFPEIKCVAAGLSAFLG